MQWVRFKPLGDILLGCTMLIVSHQPVCCWIHDRILDLGGKKMLEKLQCFLIRSIAYTCAGGRCWKYKLAGPPIPFRGSASPIDPTETTVISISHSSGMNLHKVQRRRKRTFFGVWTAHYLEDKKHPIIKPFKTPVWNQKILAWRGCGSQYAKRP